MWINFALQVLLLLLLVGVLITVTYWYVRDQFLFWAKRGVPFSKPNWLFGNFGGYIKAKIPMAHHLLNIYKEFRSERFCGVWRFLSPTLFVIDPKLIGRIMVTDSETWSTRGLPFNPDYDPLSATLVHLDGKKWKSVRSKLSPAFTPGKLKQMYTLLLECGKDFEKYLDTLADAGGLVEVYDLSTRFITDVNGLCVLGIQTNSFTNDNLLFQRLSKDYNEPTLQQKIAALLQITCPFLFKILKLSLQSRELTDFFLNIVKQNFEYREKNKVQRNDFVDLLRSLKNVGEPLGEDEVEFEDKLLAAQAFDFFIGAFESTSGTISYCFHELAIHENIQDRLREEVHQTKAAGNGEITWDGMNSMKYLDMVVQETLRKYPMTPLHFRESSKPYRIPDTDVELPTGTMCFIPTYAIHHDPDYYPDPEKFDPERFTHEAKSRRPAFTFLPFGAGPRNCIGLRFGEHQVKVALIKLLDNFQVSLCETSEVCPKLDPSNFTLIPADGLSLRISKLSSNQRTTLNCGCVHSHTIDIHTLLAR